MFEFFHKYKKFRNNLIEELGDMEDRDIIELYKIFLKGKNPLENLTSFFSEYQSAQPYSWHFGNRRRNQPNDDNDDEDEDAQPMW